MNISRRDLLKMVGVGAIGSLCTCTVEELPDVKPNIIFILADDLGYGDLGCYGQKEIRTPNLDRMAAEGMRFTQHYAGSTVCAPSRCSMMTGKHVGHCTIRGNVDVLMGPAEETVAKVLKRSGYSTACIGKWGIGHPPPPEDPHNNGFDYFFGYLSMWHAHNYYPEVLWKNGQEVTLGNIVQRPDEHYKENQGDLTGLASQKEDYSSDLFTEDALSYIDNQDKPFFLFMSYTIPHANNEAVWFDSHGMEVPDYGVYRDREWPEPEKGKAAMITRLDSDVGQILEKLKQRGLDENTLVIFTSDNGPHKEGGADPEFFKSSAELKGIKRDLYEGGIRVPMIARWPGNIKAGSENSHISAFWDLLPTLAEIADQAVPENIDGISFLPSLLGGVQPLHEFLYWEFHEGSSKQAVRMGKWKAVRLAPSQPVQLFNLDEDIGEANDLADQNPEVVAQLIKILERARTDAETWPLQDQGETMPF